MAATGIHALLDMLAASGVRYLFGNPGTTELPLSDAMADERRLQYVLALQEVPVVAIADGYAQASRSPGVVNVHICCGLGNAMGMVYNAYREGTPLILTAGHPRGNHVARTMQLPLRSSTVRRAAAVLVARGSQSASVARRPPGRRHEAHAAVHLP